MRLKAALQAQHCISVEDIRTLQRQATARSAALLLHSSDSALRAGCSAARAHYSLDWWQNYCCAGAVLQSVFRACA